MFVYFVEFIYVVILVILIDESFMYSYTMDKKILDDYSISKSYWIENQVSNLTNFYCTNPDFKWFRDIFRQNQNASAFCVNL